MKNIFTLLQERRSHGKQTPSFNSALLRVRAVRGDHEALSQIVEEAKKSKQATIDILKSNLQHSFQGFQISDLCKKQPNAINTVFQNPMLFTKLTPNDIAKIALADESFALRAIRGDVRAGQPGNPSQNYNLNNKDITTISEKFINVLSFVLNTPELLNKLTDPQLSRLKSAHLSNAGICAQLDAEIHRRAQLAPPTKRRYIGRYD